MLKTVETETVILFFFFTRFFKEFNKEQHYKIPFKRTLVWQRNATFGMSFIYPMLLFTVH